MPRHEANPYRQNVQEPTYFVGRERLVSEALECVQQDGVLWVLGPHGSGKRAFIRRLRIALERPPEQRAVFVQQGPELETYDDAVEAVREELLSHVQRPRVDLGGARENAPANAVRDDGMKTLIALPSNNLTSDYYSKRLRQAQGPSRLDELIGLYFEATQAEFATFIFGEAHDWHGAVAVRFLNVLDRLRENLDGRMGLIVAAQHDHAATERLLKESRFRHARKIAMAPLELAHIKALAEPLRERTGRPLDEEAVQEIMARSSGNAQRVISILSALWNCRRGGVEDVRAVPDELGYPSAGYSPLESAVSNTPENIALLITAVSTERRAVIKMLVETHKIHPEMVEIEGRYLDRFSWTGRKGRWDVYIGQPTEKGPHAAQALLNAFIHQKPSVAIMVGMCGGLPEHGAHEGDVVFARQDFNYHPAREREGKFRWSPSGYRASRQMIDCANLCIAHGTFGDIKVHVKDFGSGESLIDDLASPTRREIVAFSDDLLGFEMEIHGFLHGVWELPRTVQIDVAVAKGVADYGDGQQREHKEERQRLATQNALRVALAVLSNY